MALLRTASLWLSSWGMRASWMLPWNVIKSPPNRFSKSDKISSDSNWIVTSSCWKTSRHHYINTSIHYELTHGKIIFTCKMAEVKRPVIFLQIVETKDVEVGDNSAITVFRPMLEISRSCSLFEIMFEQSVSTIVSTCISFTLLTSGPRL